MDENLLVQQESAAKGLNQQQNILLGWKGTNEQQGKDVATYDMQEIQATFAPVFPAIVAASIRQFK